MKIVLRRFIEDEEGSELVEYGITMALIVCIMTVALLALSGVMSARVRAAEFQINSAGP